MSASIKKGPNLHHHYLLHTLPLGLHQIQGESIYSIKEAMVAEECLK
jgi:hypothetical protein